MTYIVADNIISSLGFTTADNIAQLQKSASGIQLCDDKHLLQQPFHASIVSDELFKKHLSSNADLSNYTRLEQLMILSVLDTQRQTDIDISVADTIFIFCTTKGNIDMLDGKYPTSIPSSRLRLHDMAVAVSSYFKNPNQPLVVSNACISGVLGIITAKRLIEAGKHTNAVVIGGDLVSKFTFSGFQSFMAISDKPCKPYDTARNGITIGEAVGTIIISKNTENKDAIAITGTATSNDANHISGPSRTGDGLLLSVKNALKQSGNKEIDYISAHGTATVYNDEMESKAFNSAGLAHVPMNSLKGYWGHTLGASGIIESIATVGAMQKNELYVSHGFENNGLPESLNVITAYSKKKLQNSLKTASGFGGCNAAIVLSKLN
jgi:3-oxoacyl-[acyl-carrier-protein] synthase-1